MLSNDESKRLAIRFKKSKDFYKTIEKLKKEGYVVYHNTKEDKGMVLNGEQTKEKIIQVGKGLNHLCSVFYEENENLESEYKQVILSIHY